MFTDFDTDTSLSGMSTQESESASRSPGSSPTSPGSDQPSPGSDQHSPGSDQHSPGSDQPSPGSGSSIRLTISPFLLRDRRSASPNMLSDDEPMSEQASSPGTTYSLNAGASSPGRSHLGSEPSEPSGRASSPGTPSTYSLNLSPGRSHLGSEPSEPSGHESDSTDTVAATESSSNDRSSPALRARSIDVSIPIPMPGTSQQQPVDRPNNEAKVRQSDGLEPPTKVRRLDSDSDLDGETCPICLEAWANSGMHRLVSLKCGHLFGKNCLERWLKAKPARERYCPTCKAKATLKDIRHIFARRLVAADSSEVTVLQSRLEQLQAEKNRVELELQKSKISHRACVTQLEGLRTTLMKSRGQKEAPVRKHWRFALEKNLEMSRDGGCRVMTYNCRTYEFYVSQKSSNNLFPGYGLRKVSCVDYKPGQFVHLHSKSIRDMTYSTQRDLLLSVGLDNTAKIVERGILTTTIQPGFPLWSCSWDYLRTNEFYVGGVGGQTLQYDIRNPSTYLQRLTAESDLSPVASLKSTEHGLLSCQLNSCWLWVTTGRLAGFNDQYEPRSLPIDGPFMSLTYDEESHRALVACRPLAEGGRARLASCKLRTQGATGEVLVDHEQTFPGSVRTTLMSRPAWVKAPGACWVAAHSESDATLYLHGLDGARTMSLPAAEPALDVLAAQLHGDTVLAALSQQRLRLYKAVPTNS